MGGFPLLDLMVPPPRPTWRGGVALTAYSRAQEGDLQWLAHDYRDPRRGGRWFRYDARDQILRCLDPLDRTGVNLLPDQPPAVSASGRLIGFDTLCF